MMDKLIMNINDYKSINQANIEINKLNIVSGVNGSGKSTLSRILYSFLKGNSIKRKDYLFEKICDDLNRIVDVLSQDFFDYDLPDLFKVSDTEEETLEKVYSLFEITKKHEKICEPKIEELNKKINDEFDILVEKLKNEGIINNNDEIDIDDENSISLKLTELYTFVIIKDKEFKDKLKDEELEDEELIDKELYDIFENLFKLENELSIYEATKSVNLICRISGGPLIQYFEDDSYEISEECFNSLLRKEEDYLPRIKSRCFEIELSNNSKVNPYEYFFNRGLINNIYYFDNVSVLDLYLALGNDIYKEEVILRHTNEFVGELFENNNDEVYDGSISFILEKIENIIGGKYSKMLPTFYADKIDNSFSRTTKYDREKKVSSVSDTPSGIKQMGIIQLLLLNNKLKKGDYLIIDEPEVNLHPDWQFKFAEILVLLAKLDITIYINSHSPLLIESISAFSEFYDMQEDVNYYLAEPSVAEGKYDFVKIKSDEIVRVYDNLGNAYDSIDQLRLKKRFGE